MNDTEYSFAGDASEKCSFSVLSALTKAQNEFNDWQRTCDTIDDIYSLWAGRPNGYTDDASWRDSELDLFWSSFEVLKPATYARPPKAAVSPTFQDNRKLQNLTAELLERTTQSMFNSTDMHCEMYDVRDDLLFAGRGVLWLRYETDDGQKVCIEHLDRTDFVHEPARYWKEVGWVARRAWLTKEEMRKRFKDTSGDAYEGAQYCTKRDDEHGNSDDTLTPKAGVWEVWHKADNKVYWVTPGVDVMLDSGEPHLDLSGFFPCPRPAYATLARRSLIPVPDWDRYAIHFRKISELTARIYLLLDRVRMKGLIPAGGEIGDAVESLMKSDDDELLIPVPGGAMMSQGATGFVAWLPIAEVADTITTLIQARTQLVDDFYQLSGISDIMRGATEANETLGAQQLKSQYGSVRVRCKVDELQRIAADAVKIAAEIVAEHFSKETLMEASQMEIPDRKAIDKRIKDIEKGAEQELKAFAQKFQETAMQGGDQQDPAQLEQMHQQGQQQIVQKYAALLEEAQSQVPMEDVIGLLRDDKARGFAFEIESDSTILTDEMQEKASRAEFLQVFSSATGQLMQLAGLGEQGAQMAGEILKFTLAPYRIGRTLDGVIDEFIDAAPQMAQAAQAAAGGGEGAGLAEANKQLAEAEQMKAQAAMAGVQAKAALDQAENQRKMAEMQLKAQKDAQSAQEAVAKLQQSNAELNAKLDKMAAETEKLIAETQQIYANMGLDQRQQDLTEVQAVQSAQQQQFTNEQSVVNAASERDFRERGEARADRGDERADRAFERESMNGVAE